MRPLSPFLHFMGMHSLEPGSGLRACADAWGWLVLAAYFPYRVGELPFGAWEERSEQRSDM